MDWRGRKYYTASFSPEAQDMRVEIIKDIPKVKLHYPGKSDYRDRFPDETEPRGLYRILIGCNYDVSESVEYELRKAERNDDCSSWKEIQRDTSKKYFDIYGQEMPYRRCDINPHKRCNNCGDC